MVFEPLLEESRDVIRFPPYDWTRYGEGGDDSLVGIARRWRRGELLDTPVQQRGQLRQKLLQLGPTGERFGQWWRTYDQILKNPAQMQFVEWVGTDRSRFAMPWTAEKPSALSLEMAFAHGWALNGRWEEMPRDDPFFAGIMAQPLWRFLRYRPYRIACWLNELKPELTVSLAGGCLPEWRHVGLRPSAGQRIVAYDPDERLTPEWLFPQLPERDCVQYQHVTLEQLFRRDAGLELPEGADVVTITGFMLYRLEHVPAMIQLALRMLRPGGSLLCDWSLESPDWAFTREVMGWDRLGSLSLLPDVDTAVIKFRTILATLPGANLVEYTTDEEVNPNPTGVFFRVQKEH